MQQRFLLQILLLAQHISGTTMPIIRSSRVFKLLVWCGAEGLQTGHITLSSTPDQQLENHRTKYHRQQPLYNTLELLMMSIVMPETCWASNKICNKTLLHLVGILFPHFIFSLVVWLLLPTRCKRRRFLFHLITLSETHTLSRTPLD